MEWTKNKALIFGKFCLRQSDERTNRYKTCFVERAEDIIKFEKTGCFSLSALNGQTRVRSASRGLAKYKLYKEASCDA